MDHCTTAYLLCFVLGILSYVSSSQIVRLQKRVKKLEEQVLYSMKIED